MIAADSLPKILPDVPADEPDIKRRKLRKGTTSCWACKKRKVRCKFAKSTDPECVACRQRGASCISQEIPEEAFDMTSNDHLNTRMARVESLLTVIAEKLPSNKPQAIHSPANFESGSPFHEKIFPCRSARSSNSPIPDISRKRRCTDNDNLPTFTHKQDNSLSNSHFIYESSDSNLTLSKILIAAFPSQKDIHYLNSIGSEHLSFFYSTLKKGISIENGQHEDVTKVPNSDTHPVILSIRLIQIVILVQHLSTEEASKLSEPSDIIIKRLTDIVKIVTYRIDLLGSLEGLESLMLETVLHANAGNLRQAWLSERRAILVAQLMGIHRAQTWIQPINPNTKFSPQSAWFRLVYTDHFLCLLLGLPRGTDVASLSSDINWENHVAYGNLKRAHISIAANILDRNQMNPPTNFWSMENLQITKNLDAELFEVSKLMPDQFWGPPTYDDLQCHSGAFILEASRLSDQIYHHSLLIQLHLPYLVNFSGEIRFEFPNISCVNASREILIRFVSFRHFNRVVSSCRFVDYHALMAALTLLLAYIDSHKHPQSILARHRRADRAILHQVLKILSLLAESNDNDLWMSKSAGLLQILLYIEEQAAHGQRYFAQKVAENHPQHDSDSENYHHCAVSGAGDGAKSKCSGSSNICSNCSNKLNKLNDDSNIAAQMIVFKVPYFGTIRLARESIATATDAADLQYQSTDADPNPLAVYEYAQNSVEVLRRVIVGASVGSHQLPYEQQLQLQQQYQQQQQHHQQ